MMGPISRLKEGFFGNILQAACFHGHEKVVQMLLDAGTDVNAGGGQYCNALQAASIGDHEKGIQILRDAGAHVDAGGQYGNALQHEKVVQMLPGCWGRFGDGSLPSTPI